MKKMKKYFKKLVKRVGFLLSADVHEELQGMRSLLQDNREIKNLLIDEYIRKNLFENPRYSDAKKLNKYEFQVYSQNGEDGIIQEIFRRIGTTNKYFVEFGVENGLECNTLFLLLQGWKGAWMDGNKGSIDFVKEKFGFLIDEKKLFVKNAFINAENIENLFSALNVPKEFDLLSIDIDGNDYWVWKAIEHYSPRVLIIEHNSMFRPPMEFVVKYDADKAYPVTSHFGASLKSMELLGREKGYNLVGCEFKGTNAFFVREDLAADKFQKPFTAENHYESTKYFLLRKIGHTRDFGEFQR